MEDSLKSAIIELLKDETDVDLLDLILKLLSSEGND